MRQTLVAVAITLVATSACWYVIGSVRRGAEETWLRSAVKAPGRMALDTIHEDLKFGDHYMAIAHLRILRASWAKFEAEERGVRNGIGDVMVDFRDMPVPAKSQKMADARSAIWRMDREELIEKCRMFGAADPEGWADSQLREGIPQLARLVFLRGAWKNIVQDGDTSWVHRAMASATPSRMPYAGLGRALRRLKQSGAEPKDITEVVRNMQAAFLFSLCYQLSDARVVEDNDLVDWGLFLLDQEGRPTHPIIGLHESVLATHPTGREMRPAR